MSLLEVKNLNTTFNIHVGQVKAVRGIDLHLEAGETLGIVGESGSGKSVTMLSVMKLLPDYAKITADKIEFDGEDILNPKYKMSSISGDKIGMVFQDPMTSLNPLKTIGKQIQESVELHQGLKGGAARKETYRILEAVGIPDPERRYRQYPHEFSGGMRQRAMIAMALICKPKLLIADEPTTALDVTIQAQILELMKKLQREENTSIIFITHNLGVVAEICDRVSVMYAGKIIEQGKVNDIFYNPQHPYTKGLLASMPRLDEDGHERLIPIEGTPIDLLNPPKGCNFAPRCSECRKICLREKPGFTDLGDGHISACWLHQMKGAGRNSRKEAPEV